MIIATSNGASKIPFCFCTWQAFSRQQSTMGRLDNALMVCTKELLRSHIEYSDADGAVSQRRKLGTVCASQMSATGDFGIWGRGTMGR